MEIKDIINNVNTINIGDIIDDYEVLEYIGRKNNQTYFKMRCNVCGHIKECGGSNIKRTNNKHSKFNCRFDFYNSMRTEFVGDFSLEEIIPPHNTGSYKMRVKCNVCNRSTIVSAQYIDKYKDATHNPFLCKEDYWNNPLNKIYGDFKIIGIDTVSNSYNAICQKCGTQVKFSRKCVFTKTMCHGTICTKALPQSIYKKVILQRFNNINERCNNPKSTHYHDYGGRGIKNEYKYGVDFYLDFINEFKTMADKYGIDSISFDRIDVNGNYCKNNIRVTIDEVQDANTRNKRFFIAVKGNMRVICDSTGVFEKEFNIPANAIGNAARNYEKTKKPRKTNGWLVTQAWNYKEISAEKLQSIIKQENINKNLIITL